MSEKIKIFGERNTSTNALRSLIEKNSTSRVAPSVAREFDRFINLRLSAVRMLGGSLEAQEKVVDRVFKGKTPIEAWKHTATSFEDAQAFKNCHVVFCVRHPASWILGLYKHPYHVFGAAPSSLSDLLDRRWKTAARERMGSVETSAIELYNLKMAHFVSMQSRLAKAGMPFSVVRHEDFTVDQKAVFSQLTPHLDNPSEQFSPLSASTKDPNKTSAYYSDYYGNERWRSEIDADSMSRICAGIDWAILSELKYYPQ